MSDRGRHGRFDVWVEIDGDRAQEFNIGIAERTSTSYIISRVGAELVVYVQEFQTMTSAFARADIYIEGQHVGKTVLSPSKGPCCFAGSWMDDNSLRPFVFNLATRKNCTPEVETDTTGSGKIVVEISEIVLFYKVDEDDDLYLPPIPLVEWAAPAITEEDESMERHIIVLADTVKQQRYTPQVKYFHSEPFDSCNTRPIAIFEFIYGSEDFIFRELKESKESSETDRNSTERSGASSPPNAPGRPTKRSQSDESDSSSSSYFPRESDESDPGCSRCSNSGVPCEPIGGKSVICWRCRRWGNGCDLPHMVQLSAERWKNMRRRRESNEGVPKGIRRRGATRGCRQNTVYIISSDSESSRPGSLEPQATGKTSRPEIHKVYEMEESFDTSSIEAHGSSSAARDDDSREIPGSAYAKNSNDAEQIPRKTSEETDLAYRGNVREAEVPGHHPSVTLTRMDADQSESSLSSVESPVRQSRINTLQHVLDAIRSFSDEMMEIASEAEGGQQILIPDFAFQLVRNHDHSRRRLEAPVIRSRIMESLNIYGSDTDGDGSSDGSDVGVLPSTASS